MRFLPAIAKTQDRETACGKVSATIGGLQFAAEAGKESHLQIVFSKAVREIVLIREIVCEVKKRGSVLEHAETVIEVQRWKERWFRERVGVGKSGGEARILSETLLVLI